MDDNTKKVVVGVVAVVAIAIAIVIGMRSFGGGSVNSAEVNQEVQKAAQATSNAAPVGDQSAPAPGAAMLPGGKGRR